MGRCLGRRLFQFVNSHLLCKLNFQWEKVILLVYLVSQSIIKLHFFSLSSERVFMEKKQVATILCDLRGVQKQAGLFCNISITGLTFFFFFLATQLKESQFPDQGLNPTLDSRSTESLALDLQRIPLASFKEQKFPPIKILQLLIYL